MVGTAVQVLAINLETPLPRVKRDKLAVASLYLLHTINGAQTVQ